MLEATRRCCWYHKGTIFQANHNKNINLGIQSKVVVDTTKVRFFKQITTIKVCTYCDTSCCWYHKGTIFQANHNDISHLIPRLPVVVDTTKVRFFKQITTSNSLFQRICRLLLIPQRYDFSSKSQHLLNIVYWIVCCCWYHKGTIFQANHNCNKRSLSSISVVVDTTKVRFFKQITTSKGTLAILWRCCWYHKGTIFQANHNYHLFWFSSRRVVVDTTKVRFFKQITTISVQILPVVLLLLIPQRYDFSSKSQLWQVDLLFPLRCCWYHKGTIFQANHNKNSSIFPYFLLLLIPQRYDFSSKSQPTLKP